MRRLGSALLVLGLLLRPAPARADEGPVRWPPGTRQVGDDLVSGRGFRETVEYLEKQLDKAGIVVEKVGPYRVRGIDVVRFVRTTDAPFDAIHVYRKDGKVIVFLVPLSPNPS